MVLAVITSDINVMPLFIFPYGLKRNTKDSSRAITFTFGQIPLGKVWTPLSSQLKVK